MTIDRFQSDLPLHVLLFTSPNAGSGTRREQVPRLVGLLQDAGVRVTRCEQINRFVELAATHRVDESIVVVAAGGDGTLALAVGLLESNAPVLPMPLGTENLLARQFGHHASAETVLAAVRHGSIETLDAGLANGKLFLIMATCGFDAEVVRGLHLRRTGHIRRLSYFRPIARAIRKYTFPRINLKVDDNPPKSCGWAMVFNLPRYGGGLSIEPDAIGNDGKLDVIAFQGGSILSGLKYVFGIHTQLHLRFRDVVRVQGQTIEVTAPTRVPYQLDGDYVGRLPLKIEIVPDRVSLIVPPK